MRPVLPSLDEIVATHRAATADLTRPDDDRFRAATSLVLHESDTGEVEALFIVRAQRDGDRWSGHVALPGGKRDDGDPDLEATARRETREEVGFEPAPAFARLPRHRGDGRIVSTYLHVASSKPHLRLDTREVEEARWVPLAAILDRDRALRFRYSGPFVFSGIGLDDDPTRGPILWGLTRGTLRAFLQPLGLALPRAQISQFRRYE